MVRWYIGRPNSWPAPTSVPGSTNLETRCRSSPAHKQQHPLTHRFLVPPCACLNRSSFKTAYLEDQKSKRDLFSRLPISSYCIPRLSVVFYLSRYPHVRLPDPNSGAFLLIIFRDRNYPAAPCVLSVGAQFGRRLHSGDQFTARTCGCPAFATLKYFQLAGINCFGTQSFTRTVHEVLQLVLRQLGRQPFPCDQVFLPLTSTGKALVCNIQVGPESPKGGFSKPH